MEPISSNDTEYSVSLDDTYYVEKSISIYLYIAIYLCSIQIHQLMYLQIILIMLKSQYLSSLDFATSSCEPSEYSLADLYIKT